MRRRIAIAIALLVSGGVILLAVPPAYEGPLLLYINAQHAIRLVDGIGLAIAAPPWLYLNWLVLRRWAGRKGERSVPIIDLNEVETILVQRFRDKRSKKVVFLAHCLLNENTRYLGGACRSGCIREIVEQCLDHDLGIVQMPCPEQRAWGGVLKRFLLMGYGLKWRYPLAYRLRGLLVPAGLLLTRLVYRRLARKVAGQIKDYITSGFSVVGIVGIDGSPSCAVNRTLDFRKFDLLFSTLVETVTADSQNASLQENLVAGRGIFVDELQKELGRRGIETPFQAHDLMAELNGEKSNVKF